MVRGAPQRGLARAMVRTSFATSQSTGGLPVRPRRDFQFQNARKPCLCQRITVSGRTTLRVSRHRAHRCESHIQKSRSRGPNRGRVERRRSRASCCRSAKFSRTRSVRAPSAARRAPSRASTRCIAAQARLPADLRPACRSSSGQRQPALGVRQRPVVALRAGHHGALVAAPHRNQGVDALGEVCGQLLRARVGEVDAELAHDRYDFGVNALAGRPP